MTARVRILGQDPGSSNYGLAVLEASISGAPISHSKKKSREAVSIKFSLLHICKVQSLYTDLKRPAKLDRETKAFIREVRGIIREYQPSHQIAERYMTRGIKGTTIEYVNMMLGTLRAIAATSKLPLHVIPASSWKNEVKRNGIDLVTDVYPQAKEMGISDHEVDSVFIALYGVFYLYRVRPFNVVDVNAFIHQVLKELMKFRRELPVRRRRGARK